MQQYNVTSVKPWNMKALAANLFFPLFLLTLIFSASPAAAVVIDKHLVGAVESINVKEALVDFEARIDTGATTTSVHAIDIDIEGESKKAAENVGKVITYTIINDMGVSYTTAARIAKVVTIRSASGTSQRYGVYMTLVRDGFEKRVMVNLADRSAMSYKLLIGRNWLQDDFVVDVSL